MAEIRLQQAETESDARNMSGSVAGLRKDSILRNLSKKFVSGTFEMLLMLELGLACKSIFQPSGESHQQRRKRSSWNVVVV